MQRRISLYLLSMINCSTKPLPYIQNELHYYHTCRHPVNMDPGHYSPWSIWPHTYLYGLVSLWPQVNIALGYYGLRSVWPWVIMALFHYGLTHTNMALCQYDPWVILAFLQCNLRYCVLGWNLMSDVINTSLVPNTLSHIHLRGQNTGHKCHTCYTCYTNVMYVVSPAGDWSSISCWSK